MTALTKLPDLARSLQGRDLSHLRIIAELWGLDLSAPDAKTGLQRLALLLLERSTVQEMVDDLPERAYVALVDLLQNDGCLAWALFTRRYGELRQVGPARRDRERPYLNTNASAVEALWYRGVVGRDFLDAPGGPQEFAYIPEDLLALLPPVTDRFSAPLGRPASPGERALPLLAGDWILDDACTLLAGLRLGLPYETIRLHLRGARLSTSYPLTPQALQALLLAAGLLDESGGPKPEPIRLFLEAERGTALVSLVKAWLHSPLFNELRLLPSLQAEGEWLNDPLAARQAVLDFLSTLPGSGEEGEARPPYWSLAAFVAAVRESHPDFQRPAGDYDSWYVRRRSDGEFLRGFDSWEAVDGELLRFLIGGPLHWLGLLDLAAAQAPDAGVAGSRTEGSALTAFRFSLWAADLLAGRPAPGLASEEKPLRASTEALLHLSAGAPRAVRYQVARFGEWEKFDGEAYRYRLTPASLDRARRQGLRTSHLLILLRKHALAVPPGLVKALERWEAQGSQASLERLVVLRVKDPEILLALRATRAARFLGDPLGPAAVIVKPGAWNKVMAALAELGYLGEVLLD